jgi:hypothetical protein
MICVWIPVGRLGRIVRDCANLAAFSRFRRGFPRWRSLTLDRAQSKET